MRPAHEQQHGQARRREPEGHQEGGGVAVAQGVLVDQPAAEAAHARRRHPGQEVAQAHQEAPPLDRDHLGDQGVEDHTLHPEEEAEQPQQGAHREGVPLARQEEARQRDAQHLHAHGHAHQEAGGQHAPAVLHHAGREDRGERHAQGLEAPRQAHHQARARELVHVERDEGGRVEQPEAGLSEQSVGEVGQVVAAQVAPDLGLEGLLAHARTRRASPAR
jgi:hypothetical protein